MKIPLSTRLLACAGFVNKGDRVADIGCDHGYLSIHLLTNGIAKSCIASDVAEGPLQSAMRNARKFGVQENISFYLSDGVRSIPRDFNTLVCAGMGGDTMIHILESAPWLRDEKYRLILQCQSKRPELRKWLYDHGFAIRRETLAKDGKFCYPVMEIVYAPGEYLTGSEFYITPALRASGSPLLPEFYDRVVGGIRTSVDGLSRTGGEKYEEMKAILDELLAMKEEIQ
jgi:tRNA (adenine22-N1)-methyltransferase